MCVSTYFSATPLLALCAAGDVASGECFFNNFTYFIVLQDNGIESKFIAFPIAGYISKGTIRTKEMNR